MAKRGTAKKTAKAKRPVKKAKRSTLAVSAKKGTRTRKGGATPAKMKRPKGPSTNESIQVRQKRAGRILKGLREEYGDVTCALIHKSALELLVSTILSAQSTDETVNRVTPELFRKYPSAKAFADAAIDDLEAAIRTTGFFRQKAKNIQGACKLMVERHGGRVPDTMDGLIELPGVARKTANVVLGTWFSRNDGVVVDTHVGRLAHRMGLTWSSKNDKDAVKIEVDLMAVLPQAEWTYASHALIHHGRAVCSARKPKCSGCVVSKDCPSAGTIEGAQ